MKSEVHRDDWCRHRTAFDDAIKVCKAGVNYHQFQKSPDGTIIPGYGALMPCLGQSAEAKARCPQYSGWTAEEIAAREADMEARLGRIGTIRKAIVAETKSTLSRSGVMPCPACGTGKVSWSMASNGHVHARCSTPQCASWME